MTDNLRRIISDALRDTYSWSESTQAVYDAVRPLVTSQAAADAHLPSVEGFIAGRTSLTRENIAEIIYANTEQIDYCGYGLMVVDDPLELADKILELAGGATE